MLALIAQGITNPAVPAVKQITDSAPDGGVAGGLILAKYIAILIQTSLMLGALAVLLYMFLGAINWITAGGDPGKIEKAQQRIIQALVGLAVLFSVVAVLVFIGPVFGINFLQIQFINQLGGSGGGGYPTGGGGGGGGNVM